MDTGYAKHMRTKHFHVNNFSEIAPAEYEGIGGMHHRYRLCKAYADKTF